MATIRLDALRTLIRAEADQEGSTFVSDAVLNSWINKSADELYDVLVGKDQDYYSTSAAFVTVKDQEHVLLPADFLKLSYLELQLAGTDPFLLKRAPKNLHSALRRAPKLAAGVIGEAYYWLRKDRFSIFPVPGAVLNGTIWYVPQRTQLVADGDTFDGFGGWEEYVVVDAAIKCLAKEESDVGVMMARKQQLLARVNAASKDRDQGEPGHMVDVDGADLEDMP